MVSSTPITRSYYSETYKDFLNESDEQIIGKLMLNDTHSNILDTQKNAWAKQIKVLKQELGDISIERILFEYQIPRMGKRVDNVLFYKGVVYILEFKVGEDTYKNSDLLQVEGYAFDLKHFQEGSRNCKIIPILVCTKAPDYINKIEMRDDGVYKPLRANEKSLHDLILKVSKIFDETPIDSLSWENSIFNPTPTIIEASIALYENHAVEEITRRDSVGTDFVKTSKTIRDIIAYSKNNSKKSLIFLTGIPGSGKTLVGLDIASKYQDIKSNEYAVYISGTYTLIEIIQEALARDKVEKSRNSPKKVTKKDAKTEAGVLFQFLPNYRQEILRGDQQPREKIVVFDEAQRMWNQIKFDKTIEQKLHKPPMGKSETDLLLGYMDKHEDWAVILCLIGGGQEIHDGEDGTIEWVKSVQMNFKHWDVYMSPEFMTVEYLGDLSPAQVFDGVNKKISDALHLKTATRSFRAENFSKFVNHLLNREINEAKQIVHELNQKPEKEKFHLLITRDIKTAKNWVKTKARVNERYGIFVNSKSLRLIPEGIVKRNQRDFNSIGWWLDSEDYIDSSLKLEVPCAEFFAQGLEVDWAIFGWDACLRPNGSDWEYLTFSRKNWETITKKEERRHLKNSFRVLLTRARQGMIIFVPKGDVTDKTFLPEFYDKIYNHLIEIGIKEI